MNDQERQQEIEKMVKEFNEMHHEIILENQSLKIERDFYKRLAEEKMNYVQEWDGKLRLVK